MHISPVWCSAVHIRAVWCSSAVWCSEVWCNEVRWSVVWRSAVRCISVQYDAARCISAQYVVAYRGVELRLCTWRWCPKRVRPLRGLPTRSPPRCSSLGAVACSRKRRRVPRGWCTWTLRGTPGWQSMLRSCSAAVLLEPTSPVPPLVRQRGGNGRGKPVPHRLRFWWAREAPSSGLQTFEGGAERLVAQPRNVLCHGAWTRRS